MEHQRRAYPRRSGTFRVAYVDPAGRAGWDMVRDFSRQGMFLKSADLALGETILLIFLLPTGHPCTLQAEVVRTAPDGVGLRFTSPHEPLDAYCDTWEPPERWCDASAHRR